VEGVQVCTIYVQTFAVQMHSASSQDVYASNMSRPKAFYSTSRSTATNLQAYKFGVPETNPLTTLVIN